MCGRFVSSTPVSELAELLDATEVDLTPPGGTGEITPPRWNVAPQSTIWALSARRPRNGVAENGQNSQSAQNAEVKTEPARRLAAYKWGLVPYWAKDVSIGARLFNARAETLTTKPAFRHALGKGRCIVPADAFYEWAPAAPGCDEDGRPHRKQPFVIRPSEEGEVLAFAGLCERWPDRSAPPRADGGPSLLPSCTIITTVANELVAPLHDRMPVILAPADFDEWLTSPKLSRRDLARLLCPAPAGSLEACPVSARVGDSRAEGADLAEPVGATRL
jgi:putative SOS response-associated peptidase YedK